jgi:uncharacterized protein HemX
MNIDAPIRPWKNEQKIQEDIENNKKRRSIMKKIGVLIVFALVLTVPGFGYCRGDSDHKNKPVNQNININTQINIQKDTQKNILTNIQTNINGNSFPDGPGSSCNGGHEFGGNEFGGWFGRGGQ